MKSLISQLYKNANWVCVLLLVLTTVGCGKRSSAAVAPQVEGGLNIEVVAGRVQIGEATSNRFAGVGETFSLTMGNRISTNQTGEAELVIAGNTRLQLAPNATLELANQDADTAIILRQLGGTVTFDLDTPTLSVTGSTGLGFGSGGLERVKFLVKTLAENSVFTVDVSRNIIQVAVKEGEVAVDINDKGYQLQPGESLNAESSDRVEISRALTERPIVSAAGSVKAPTQLSGSSGQPAITSTISQTVASNQGPTGDDLSSSEEAPQLLAPPNGASFSSAEIITLNWQSTATSDQDTWYEVQLWRNDDSGFGLINIIQDTEWQPLETLAPGEYQWHVQLIRLSDRQYLSPPSEVANFTVIAPTATPTVAPTDTPAPVPTSTPTPVPISTPTEVVTDTSTPAAVQASYPEIVLTGPEADKVFAFEEQPITLQWQPVGTLGDNQWYEVRVLRNGTEWLGAFKTKEPEWTVPPEYNPGIYGWRVAVIITENGEWAGDISPESEMRLFTWNPPPQPSSGSGDDKGSKPPGSR